MKGGLKAGNFTDVGTVESIDSCTRLCCVSERCNLAMLINGHCFLVNCFSKELCKTVKTETKNYRPTVAFVRRWVTNVTEDTGMCGSALKVNATTSWQTISKRLIVIIISALFKTCDFDRKNAALK